MAKERPLPRDTNSVVQRRLNDCRNLGLLLNKFNPWIRQPNGRWQLSFEIEEVQHHQWQKRLAFEGEAKRFWLSERNTDKRIRFIDRPLAPNSRMDGQLLAAYYKRWQQGCTALGAISFELTTASRLVVGLGIESVLETSLALHRIHGFPIIPGSALKGLARKVAFFELAQTLGVMPLSIEEYKQRKEAAEQTPLDRLASLLESDLSAKSTEHNLQDLQREPTISAEAKIKEMSIQDLAKMQDFNNFRLVFGLLEQAGCVIFLDAVPKNNPTLAVDVMNPHYPDYYRDDSGKTPPSDDQSPNPVAFLSVAEGTIFGFALVPRCHDSAQAKQAVSLARRWLETGLREVGIGAKTAAGYGVFH